LQTIPSPTKGGNLILFKPALEKHGIIVPPFKVITPPFGEKRIEIANVLAFFRRISNPEGPFLPYAIVRINGSPKGTGEGSSEPIPLDCSPRMLIELMENVQQSDANAQGVVFQIFTGQPLHVADRNPHAPLIGGIAYTPSCTERKNAVLEWFIGHPKRVVEPFGEYNYSAFNKQTLGFENQRIMKKLAEKKNARVLHDIPAYPGSKREVCFGFDTFNVEEVIGKKNTPLLQKAMLEWQNALLQLDEVAPLYLELGITFIKGKFQRFAFQAAVPDGKKDGMTWDERKALDNLKKNMDDARIIDDINYDRLKSLHNDAISMKDTFAASFDVVGKGQKELSRLIVMDSADSSNRAYKLIDKNTLLVLHTFVLKSLKDCLSNISSDGKLMVPGGILEFNSVRKKDDEIGRKDGATGDELEFTSTFRAHLRGFCGKHGIFGLGEGTVLLSNLASHASSEMEVPSLLPGTVMEGKFIMDVDEGVSFGKLSVERVDKIFRE